MSKELAIMELTLEAIKAHSAAILALKERVESLEQWRTNAATRTLEDRITRLERLWNNKFGMGYD